MSPENSSPRNSPPKDAEVEQNVIAVIPSENTPVDQQASTNTSSPGDEVVASNSPPSTRVSSRSPPPGTINMSGLRTTFPDIPFNSPSTNIIGTPYAHTTSNTPFEYPFPETSPDSASSLPSHPLFRPGSPHGSFHPPPHPPPPADIHPSNSGPFNLIHPKPRVQVPASPPPMPPSLKKKRWSLNLLGRRRTSNPPTPTGDLPSSPLGSPPAVKSGAILGGLGSGRPKLVNRQSSGSKRSGKSVDSN